MAYTAKDGKRFESNETGRTYDRSRGHDPDGGKKAAKPKAEKKAKEPEEHEQPIGEVVDEHGPAEKTEIEKDGDGYTVHSHHEDGHKHTSEGHDSIEAAHEHSMRAHGHEPEGEEALEEETEMPAMGHMAPPGMAHEG